MIIKSIALKDFRQYKNRQEIKFSTDIERNVTVVLGLNTSGKTTLIEAFKWCLYGTTTYNIKDLINVETLKEMDIRSEKQVYVEINLIHDNTEYIIKRMQDFKKTINKEIVVKKSNLHVSYKLESGELKYIELDDTQNSINKILPAELSDYFFFDGERIGDIGTRSDIKNAVEGLMGLDVITEAKNMLNPSRKASITTEFEAELDIGSDKSSKKLQEDLLESEEKLIEYKKDIKNVEKERKIFQDANKELSNRIAANKSVKEREDRRVKLEKELKNKKTKLEKKRNEIRNYFSEYSLDFFTIPLVDKAMNILNSTEEKIEGIEGMTAKAIDDILSREACICGNDLKNNDAAVKMILKEKKLLPPYHIGTIINQTKISLNHIESRGHDVKNTLFSEFKIYENWKSDMDETEKKLDNVIESLKNDINVGELELERVRNEKKLDELEIKRDRILQNLGSLETKIQTLRKRKESLVIASKRNEEIKKCIKYSKALYNIFYESYREKEKIVKKSLEDNVNEIFEKIYHGKRFIRIDDDYRVSLDVKVSDEMMETDLSKGLEAVKNFSFVAGLVKIAKEKVKDADDISTEEPYPLVMDAPFSNVDEIHIENISKVLPAVSEQVIWILMEKDWNHAKKSLGDKIGYIYNIEKVNNSETHSIVEEGESYF